MERVSRIIDAFQVLDKVVLHLEEIPFHHFHKLKIDNELYGFGHCYDMVNCLYITTNLSGEYFINKDIEFI